ncbi:aftiphilin isoform X2 [Pseudophryne corroboree]|uniref:aftiphilin isoform X2 n=1 Tax=Pseudophryne corroboree TaxID=495146 RepID=UPI0030812954
MEPEIIRMYSSSPPPLDSVADDDEDDEFGEFGGFAEVNNSGISFSDFDAVGYPKSREEFIPSNHFLPIHDYSDNVNNFTSLTSIKANENISEISSSKKGHCSVFETNIAHFNDAALDNKGTSGENTTYLNSETHHSCVDNADVISRSQDRIGSTCNGDKIHSLENLTNGFAVIDSDSPQGLQDLDSMGHSKGFKSISSHSTDLSIDFSPPSPGDDFADFATFSRKDSVHLDDTDQQAHKVLPERQAQSVKPITGLSRYEEGSSSSTEVLKDPVPQTVEETHYVASESDTLATDSVPSQETVTPILETNLSDSMQAVDTKRSPDIIHSRMEEVLQTVGEMRCTTPEKSLERSEDVKKVELDSQDGHTNSFNVSPDQSQYDSTVGDLDAASEKTPQTLTDHSKSDKMHLHEPLELDSDVKELNSFDDFEDTNNLAFQEKQADPSETLELHDETDKCSQLRPCEEPSLTTTEECNIVEVSDDFADFSTAGNIEQPAEWNAFEDDEGESPSWAAFGEQKTDSPAESDWQSFRTDMPSGNDEKVLNTQSVELPAFHESGSTFICEDPTFAFQHSLLSRLERVIQACFPPPPVTDIEEKICSLDVLLCPEQREDTSQSLPRASLHTEVLDIWTELQDIHDAYGLKYQWGGSHSNKKLLCSLGIDTRNILYTGNKKQPVIVPMYAAGLGMLEPTKEPLKPLSAAEKIASIGLSSPVPPDDGVCSPDQLQESLPPVQFDWSSSGLTNPLDGVDPELYALTTSKVESSSASSKVTDAFARLMSTAEATSTSARKPRRDENLSEEAAKVIASLPDLSFMHAKVLMFPVSLTPSTSSQHKVD